MIFDIVSEPVGRTYESLLAGIAEYSTTALVVVRDPEYLGSSAKRFFEQAEPWCTGQEQRAEWPGTIMKNFLATVFTYRLDSDLLSLMQATAGGLYQWQQPDLPEDLCFLRSSQAPSLVTIAHERDAYLDLSKSEAESLQLQIPSLKLSRRNPVS